MLCASIVLGPWVRDTLSVVLWGVTHVQEAVPLPRAVLESRLAALEDEVSQTKYQSVLYASQVERIRTLEAELGLRPQEAYLSAEVLAAPPRTHYDTLLIRSGAVDGVQLGDMVSAQGIALGTVTAVSDATATVQLFSSPGATQDALVGEGAIIVVTGVGGGALEAYAPGELAVSVGDTVSDARSGEVFGVIASIVRREVDTEQYLMITIPLAPSSVRLVSLTHSP